MGQAPENPSMDPLLDAILEHVPPPPGDPQGQFAMLVTMTERDLFLGRVATGRIASGRIKVGDKLKVLRHNGGPPSCLATRCCCLFAQRTTREVLNGSNLLALVAAKDGSAWTTCVQFGITTIPGSGNIVLCFAQQTHALLSCQVCPCACNKAWNPAFAYSLWERIGMDARQR